MLLVSRSTTAATTPTRTTATVEIRPVEDGWATCRDSESRHLAFLTINESLDVLTEAGDIIQRRPRRVGRSGARHEATPPLTQWCGVIVRGQLLKASEPLTLGA